jgi:hypothetical protein
VDDILDLKRFPLDDLDSPAGAALIDHCRAELDRFGMFNLDGLIRADIMKDVVGQLDPRMQNDAYRQARRHNIQYRQSMPGAPTDHPSLAQFNTVNHTLCADQMTDSIVLKIYEYPGLIEFLARVMEKPKLYAMADPLARVNVMRYGEGEGLNWHFDRSDFTTTLLLQAPQHGGLFQYARDLRSDDDPGYDKVEKLVSGDWPIENVPLWPGTLNVFRGKHTAHRVTPVSGAQARMIAVFSYFDEPDVEFSEEERIGFYGRAH